MYIDLMKREGLIIVYDGDLCVIEVLQEFICGLENTFGQITNQLRTLFTYFDPLVSHLLDRV